jgi:hypothetical protein
MAGGAPGCSGADCCQISAVTTTLRPSAVVKSRAKPPQTVADPDVVHPDPPGLGEGSRQGQRCLRHVPRVFRRQ